MNIKIYNDDNDGKYASIISFNASTVLSISSFVVWEERVKRTVPLAKLPVNPIASIT